MPCAACKAAVVFETSRQDVPHQAGRQQDVAGTGSRHKEMHALSESHSLLQQKHEGVVCYFSGVCACTAMDNLHSCWHAHVITAFGQSGTSPGFM